jgi:membrane-associated PAP2 superfamily phosphatase
MPQTVVPPASQGAWDSAATGLALVALLAWDFLGADAAFTRHFGSASGFALRHNFWFDTVLHGGGRALGWACLLGLLATAVHKAVPTPGNPPRTTRVFWLLVTVGCLLAVPGVKLFSSTSCPWDLAEFGGTARWLSHWQWGVADGGPGHCFPSGHAVAAFAFFTQYFLWRPFASRRARGWLTAVLLVGALLSFGQVARGAHHVSHGLWSAWLCWTLCVVAHALRQQYWRWLARTRRKSVA